MKFIVAKAAPVATQDIPDIEIQIGPEFPPYGNDTEWVRRMGQFYNVEAQKLMEALQSLPGGTWDRLLCLMLDKKASLYRVRLFEPEEKP